MSAKRKRKFSTWADAELLYEIESRLRAVLEIALQELVNGSVEWLYGMQPRKIGLCKLGAAHGGVVILVEREMMSVKYLDDWAHGVETQPAPPHSKEYKPEYQAWLDIRQLAAAAKTMQEEAQKKAAVERGGCTSSTPAEIVDQDVRQY